jgi:hypothetical protein
MLSLWRGFQRQQPITQNLTALHPQRGRDGTLPSLSQETVDQRYERRHVGRLRHGGKLTSVVKVNAPGWAVRSDELVAVELARPQPTPDSVPREAVSRPAGGHLGGGVPY